MRVRRGRLRDCAGFIFAAVLFLAVVTAVTVGVSRAERAASAEALRTAEQAVRRAAVSCYAVEGAYPASYEYLRDEYGVRVNEDKYIVEYSIFASNIMPDITILEK